MEENTIFVFMKQKTIWIFSALQRGFFNKKKSIKGDTLKKEIRDERSEYEAKPNETTSKFFPFDFHTKEENRVMELYKAITKHSNL